MEKLAGVLGSGPVGQALAAGLLGHGYKVMVGSRGPGKLSSWLAGAGKGAEAGTFEATAAFGQLLLLACHGSAAEKVLDLAGLKNLAGKTIIDATNPIAEAPPEDGVLRFFTGPNESLMERLQLKVPEARFVKAFSCVGNAFMVHPKFPGGRPTMFICGNSAEAKQEVQRLLEVFGWESADMGRATAARAIEPLAMLWCIPGLQRNEWTHAFKLLRL